MSTRACPPQTGWSSVAAVRARLEQIVVNSRDPQRLARFWAGLVGGVPVDREHGWSHVEPPGIARLAFQPAPDAEPSGHVHLDLGVPDIGSAVEVAVALGAVPVGALVVDEQGSFQVMADPEGNVFCFVHD